MIRTILWIVFVGSVIFFLVQGAKFDHAGTSDIETYEYADAGQAREILASWDHVGLLHTVRATIRYDFFFIVIYLVLMIGCSNDQVTREWSPLFNQLLRLNILLAFVVAILDVTENLIVLYNISKTGDHVYCYWITRTKFALAYWIVGIWVISKLKTWILKGTGQRQVTT